MDSTLAQIFLKESVDDVRHREQTALEDILLTRNNRVVLFGAGNLGRQAGQKLRGIGVIPLCFSDNNQDRWGTKIDGLDVLPPSEAASLYGGNSAFLVTIWNAFHWFRETAQQLSNYGCDLVVPYVSLHWRFPETFLPCLLNDLPHKLYQDRNAVLKAAELWADRESQNIYEANIRFRALGDLNGLPGRPIENSYLPLDLIQLSASDRFLDCGATGGEMLHDLIGKRGEEFDLFCALEADNISFPTLEAHRDRLTAALKAKIQLLNCAVGARRQTVHFTHTGLTGSKISDDGLPVDCFPIDELFAETPLTFIKMDIEGAEYDALLGAAKIIQRDRPILAICVYHTQNDIWRIPLLIREMVPEYKFYLRAYEGDGFQTVMYAVPPHRVLDDKS